MTDRPRMPSIVLDVGVRVVADEALVADGEDPVRNRFVVDAISQGNLFIASYHYGSPRSTET